MRVLADQVAMKRLLFCTLLLLLGTPGLRGVELQRIQQHRHHHVDLEASSPSESGTPGLADLLPDSTNSLEELRETAPRREREGDVLEAHHLPQLQQQQRPIVELVLGVLDTLQLSARSELRRVKARHARRSDHYQARLQQQELSFDDEVTALESQPPPRATHHPTRSIPGAATVLKRRSLAL
ncbi:hypothetical protein QAD02_014279 [Eretmocerus hayati]|uniref:Uncharacterized protein n=1 Tax=Eretmocerus hayati TaxID=131215 RepID=A0ACC2P7Q1_9HYME|nr:hypothetical protein QAD02_014279 [Eretmocerus hayati]